MQLQIRLMWVLLEILLISMTLSQLSEAENGNSTRRVYYGDPTSIERYPFYASLFYCGAVVLSQIWVMTAAHCMDPDERKHGTVWVGGNNYWDSLEIPYSNVIVHPGYKDIVVQLNDLALIRLDLPLKYTERIQPVRLPSENNQNKHLVLVARGIDEVNTPVNLRSLKKVNLERLSPEECLQRVPPVIFNIVRENLNLLQKINICMTRPGGGPSVCNGDSGSPLVYGNELIGLYSSGPTVCEKGKLGFFTNVHYYLPWIKNITGL